MENIHKWIWLLKKIWLLGTSLVCLSNMKTIEYICFVILIKDPITSKDMEIDTFPHYFSDLSIDEFSRKKMDATAEELSEEKALAYSCLT